MNNNLEQEIRWFKTNLANNRVVSALKQIQLIITDVDGTLTDGNVFIPLSREEKELKGISMQDDFIINKTLEQKLQIAIITGRKNHAFKKYIHDIGIPSSLYFEGIDKDKFKVAARILKKLKLNQSHVLMFGDEYLDFEVKKYVGMYAVPANTPCYLQTQADLVTLHAGGNGALRMLLDLLLYVQKKHFAQHYIDLMIKNY